MDDMDEEEGRKEKAMLRKVDELTKQIKWPRTRSRHARKAAAYMREWSHATKDIEPGSTAAIKAMTNIMQGVQPKELRHEVDVARNRALPEGGTEGILPFVNSVQFAGMLILHAAKQLDIQDEKARRSDARSTMAGMSRRLRDQAKRSRSDSDAQPIKTPAVRKSPRSKIRTRGRSRIRRVDQRTASHGVSEAFMQTPTNGQSTLSDDDLRDMGSDSDEPDTISPVVMARLVSGMTTHKREETLEMLQDLADENSGKPKANKILAVIKYIAPRKGKHFPTGESYKQRKARKVADALMQKEIVRKLATQVGCGLSESSRCSKQHREF